MRDYEADVVIVGYGGAGAAAAIVASDAGARVLIIEKSPAGGGNTKYSGGSIRTYLDLELATDFYETLCEGTTDRDVIDTFVKESADPEWLKNGRAGRDPFGRNGLSVETPGSGLSEHSRGCCHRSPCEGGRRKSNRQHKFSCGFGSERWRS